MVNRTQPYSWRDENCYNGMYYIEIVGLPSFNRMTRWLNELFCGFHNEVFDSIIGNDH